MGDAGDLYDQYGVTQEALIGAANVFLDMPDFAEHLDRIRCTDPPGAQPRVGALSGARRKLDLQCICGLRVGYHGFLWKVIKDQYPQVLAQVRQVYGLPDVNQVNRGLTETIVKQAVKRIRLYLEQDGLHFTDPNAKSLLYRFTDPREIAVGGIGDTTEVSLRTLYDRGFLAQAELQRFQRELQVELDDVIFRLYRGQYHLRSAERREISLAEYLNPSKGIGGHISGWQEYQNLANEIGSVSAAYRAFSDGGRRPLFIIQSPNLADGDLRHALLPTDRAQQRVEWTTIEGEYPEYLGGELGRLGTVTVNYIPYTPGVIKLFRAGWLMPGVQSNPTEVDLVGQADLYGCVAIADRPSSVAYELLLRALRRCNLVSIIMPLGANLPDVDVPAPVPDNY